MNRHWLLVLTLLVLFPAACADGGTRAETTSRGELVPSAWYRIADDERADASDPDSTVPELDLDADCLLRPEVRIAGDEAKPFGAGASRWGDDGARYVCQFTKPSAQLIVIRGQRADFDELRDEVNDADDGRTVAVGSREFHVAQRTYPNGRTEWATHLFDEEHTGVVLLSVEADPSYGHQQAAEDLAAILDGD